MSLASLNFHCSVAKTALDFLYLVLDFLCKTKKWCWAENSSPVASLGHTGKERKEARKKMVQERGGLASKPSWKWLQGPSPIAVIRKCRSRMTNLSVFFYEMVKHRRVEDLTQWMEPLFLRPVDPIRNPCIHGKARHSGLCVCL